MLYNYKLEEQTITNIIKRHIKPIKKQKEIKLIIYYTVLLRITATPLNYT